ncbi:MAG TPA: hypothetical protein VFK80_04085, partial [Limnochordia bacterium]|nr:hypothetical protein [Limnochordia bacterium]
MKNLHISAAVLTGLLAVAGSALAADPVTVDIGQPVNAITVDGSLAEWQGVTPIKLDATMTADAKDVTDDKDLSAVAYAADYSGTLYLAVDVTDDKIVMERNADGNLWQSDAVEFWLGGQQFGITVDKDTHKVAALSWGG